MTHLQADHITIAYNSRTVVNNLSLSVREGEVIGLIGPNGAGKTSVLRGLAGLHPLRSGKALLDGRDVRELSALERARVIGFVPQGEHYVWNLTVEEIVLLGRAAHRGWLLPYSATDRAMVENVLAQTDLLGLRTRPVDKLSGGERQRTLIARVLAQEARVLLLDEPTANLDFRFQMQVFDLARQLAYGSGLAILVAIHDLGMAARYCDRLLLLSDGHEFASGTAPQVFTPQNMQTIFGVHGELYRDPHGQWAISAKRMDA
jgi:iron complex transport system ATP-binding protein